ncbi:MAG: hypothetical protein WCJ35_17515 [Planctomycetota bacterium]
MPLGPNKWNADQPFYDGLTLAVNGDPIEKQAVTQFDLGKRFPHYESFWKRHVCPATDRPWGINLRSGVSDIISVIAQRSYSVLVYTLEAVDHLREVSEGRLGPRNRNCYITLMYAGNALQVFMELKRALCGTLVGMDDLATRLSMPIDPFLDWKTTWEPDRKSASNYRNYVTHQGYIYSVLRQSSGERMVLSRDAFKTKTPYTWLQAEAEYNRDPSKWIDLFDACRGIVDDTITFLDRAYEKIICVMDPLLETADYQRLWGWVDHQPSVLPAPALPASMAVPTTMAFKGISMTIGSAVTVDQKYLDASSPPGSGERRV